MNKPRKTVLIVEDEKDIRELLDRAFRASSKFDFETKCFSGIPEYLKERSDGSEFDAAILDLKLSNASMEGLAIGLIRTIEHPMSTIFIYSAFDDRETMFSAMRRGATDFFSKNDCLPSELVRNVEDYLDRQEKNDRRREQTNAFLVAHADELRAKYQDKHIIIIDDIVVAEGATRLETLLQYEKKRISKPTDWPDIPNFIEINSQNNAF